ncbi:hypothetical protein RQP46_005113 [Phenoliferia psychrophenolica]
MSTAFTKLLSIKLPIVCAPMAGVAGGRMAAATSKGGGLGLMGFMEGEQLAKEVAIARSELGLNADDALPIGFGVLGFRIETPATKAAPYLRSLVAQRPAAIWLSFGRRLEEHIGSIRAAEKEFGVKVPVIVMVGTVELGVEVAKWGADVIVAQGTESGGHGNMHSTGLPLLTLLPALSSALTLLPTRPLVLAAGGISHASQIEPLLQAGASGVVIGTALLASPESLYSPAHKRRVLAAVEGEAVRTLIFDRINGFDGEKGYGIGIDGRALKNEIVEGEEKGEGFEQLKVAYEAAKGNDEEMKRIVIWAGVGVGLVNSEESTETIVRRIGEDLAA